jgi:N-acetyl-anhydromuramyl-L-alanine amidase AmpD
VTVAVVLSPLVQRRSPNQSSRRGAAITHLVWHATAGHYAPSIAWLCTPTTYWPDGRVKSGPDASAHLVAREDGGEVTQLVHLAEKAWHAYPTWNAISVGVEHASMGAGFASNAQLAESARIFGWLCWHLSIPPVFGLHRPRGIVRHRDLGAAGGGHSDGPSDQVWFHEYLPLVQHELERGGFRKVWAL